ncbi:RNA polymerase sigma factor [Paenibacillus woosongensis]|uniref:Sigma-70 family RNA polymerase sigma factor n=1 Tax=Paenibacillus woosongensis TaxID=307580 RepID=A0ABQ4MLC6_9BACL|nr:RNA polymerase sigma factor [Paenibacillus woosongensis]GIP56794.1 hypothetical protein J15TS10_06080 [Paenibacillus woosongensis]
MEEWFHLLRNPIHNCDVVTQERVYRSFSRYVYKDIYLIVYDRQLTQDIIQEAFFKISTLAPRLRSAQNILGWIRQVTRHTTVDFLRKWKLDRQVVSNIYDYIKVGTSEISLVEEVETKIRNELLYQALSELKLDYRTMLHMCYLEGQSYREISKVLNLSETALNQRMARARKKLLKHFLSKWADCDERKSERSS